MPTEGLSLSDRGWGVGLVLGMAAGGASWTGRKTAPSSCPRAAATPSIAPVRRRCAVLGMTAGGSSLS